MAPLPVWSLTTSYSPPALQRLSLSALVSVEACPRRGWLAHGRGAAGDLYPLPAMALAGRLRGLVIHGVVERLLRSQAGHGPFDLRSALRALGGWRRLIGRVAVEQAAPLAENQRLPVGAARELEEQLIGSSWLEEIQTVALRLIEHLGLEGVAMADGPPRPGMIGAWVEAELTASFGGEDWHGRVDFVRVDEGGVTICDFKSGLSSAETTQRYAPQLRAYAVLWNKAYGGAPARLRLLHPDRAVDVPPLTMAELDSLCVALGARAVAARAAVSRSVPVAHVGEQCAACSVRQRCDDYWQRSTISSGARFHDFEVEILSVEPTLLHARIVRSTAPEAPHGASVRVVRERGSPRGLDGVEAGDSLRLLGYELRVTEHRLTLLSGREPSSRTSWRGAEAFSFR
jgi:hypothetical protein